MLSHFKKFRLVISSSLDNRNISMRELSKKVGISPSYLSRILSGERKPPSNEIILKIIKLLGIESPDEIFIELGRIPPKNYKLKQLLRIAIRLDYMDFEELLKYAETIYHNKRFNKSINKSKKS